MPSLIDSLAAVNSTHRTIQQSFLEPDDEFTPIPFWFWNDALDIQELIRQIQDFKAKGVTGFVIHPRLGVPESIPYMSDTYLQFVEAAVQEAERQNMVVFLYDEAMYPSGSAMGMVVKTNPQFASRGLARIEYLCEEPYTYSYPLQEGETLVSAQAIVKRAPDRMDPARTIILESLDNVVRFVPPDEEDWVVVLFIEKFSKGTIRGIHFGQDDGEPGAPPSADLLNKQATETFIHLTHDRYYERLKTYFGHTVQAMFTDEPHILGRRSIPSLKPWTYGFLEYVQSHGLREEELPLLWLDGGEGTDAVRRTFRKAVNARLHDSYYKPLSDWCDRHGVQLTGHPGGSDEIGLLQHFQLPGQDVVWRYVEPVEGKILDGVHSTLAKCASDSARHRGRRRNANECFGACGKDNIPWNFTPDEMKWYMDWLFVRGTNLLIPHAFYYSIFGERMNERPPDVGPNNIWWKHYNDISRYMRRMSWLMTDSVNVAQVAILCEEDALPWRIAKPLYENQIEFNYLEESLFVSSCLFHEGSVRIAEQIYKVIVVEAMEQLSELTVNKLQSWIDSGGQVIVLESEEVTHSLRGAIPIYRVESVSEQVNIGIKHEIRLQPSSASIRVSHIRKGEAHLFLLVNEGEERFEGDIHLGTLGRVERWDPWLGTIQAQPVQSATSDGMQFPMGLDRRESVIYYVDRSQQSLPVELAALGCRANQEGVDLSAGWTTTGSGSTEASLDALTSWTTWPGLESYSGTIEYEHFFNLEDCELGKPLGLDLGDIRDIAEVYVNDVHIGTRMWSPYRFSNIDAAVQSGRNKISVKVTNSLANAYNQAQLLSGLLGPVKLIK
ncbi:MAG: hypothetical protein K0R28_215 [Paenibacillus sp.]|nr:hypothetical protein [Paenibacillus sp.]